MSRGRTLWEMFTDWLAGSQELKHFNPLKARIGHAVTIDDIDWRDRNFKLRELRITKRTIRGKKFVFADYVVGERTLKGEETELRIRYNPTADADRGGDEFHALLLSLEDEFEYSDDFHEVVSDPSGIFRIENEGKVEAEFRRLHGLTEPYKAVVTVLADEDQNKKVTSDEVNYQRIEYWDFERDITDFAGQPTKEYLFVELDTVDGWFQLWRGSPLDTRKVMVM